MTTAVASRPRLLRTGPLGVGVRLSRTSLLLLAVAVAAGGLSLLAFHMAMFGSLAIALPLSLVVGVGAGAATWSVLPLAALLRDIWKDTARPEAGQDGITRW